MLTVINLLMQFVMSGTGDAMKQYLWILPRRKTWVLARLMSFHRVIQEYLEELS